MDMSGRLLLLPMALLLLAAAPVEAPTPPPVCDSIITDARAASPSGMIFERTTTTVKHSPISRETQVTVDRWDGQRWALVSVNGKAPDTGQVRNFRNQTAAQPVPGYYRLADILAAARSVSIDDQGRQIVSIPILPAGSVRTDKADISHHLSGEAVIATSNGRPWVAQLKLRAHENFKLTSLIKVTNFQQTFDYRLGPDGRPRLAAQSALSKGQMFGFTGGETNEVVYAYH